MSEETAISERIRLTCCIFYYGEALSLRNTTPLIIPAYLTNRDNFSINTIDKITNVCYTQNKLENKTKILTNNKNKQNKNKKDNKWKN